MAANVLVEEVFNFICGSGGFVELSVLLKQSSPLGSRKSKVEAKNWLTSQDDPRLIVVKDFNGEIAGVRINLRRKICRQYHDKGSCGSAQGKCKFWHICKGFIEENCHGKCNRLHNFFDPENNENILKELGLAKYPNGTIKNIVAWSLPQVCELYTKGKCTRDSCLYLHFCSQAVRSSACSCSLSHDLTDSHNMKILKQYDLVPHQSMSTDFVRCNTLVPKEQRVLYKVCESSPEVCNADAKMLDAALAVIQGTKPSPKVSASLKHATKSQCDTVKQSSFNNLPNSSVQECAPSKKAVFDCIVKEYDGTVSFELISKRQDLFPNICADIAKWFEARKQSFLVRKKKGTIFQVSVLCRKARFCFKRKCSQNDCPYFHVCREYIAGFCRRGGRCQRNHSFQYDKDRKLISKLNLDGLTEEHLRKVFQLSLPQVCLDYNNGCCTKGLSCSQVHICKDYVRESCEDEEAGCGLRHESAFANAHTVSILQNFGLRIIRGKVDSVRRTLLVCESISSGLKDLRGSIAAKGVIGKVSGDDQDMKSKEGIAVSSSEPSKVKVHEYLAEEYDCSASLQVISKRKDLPPYEFQDVERERNAASLYIPGHWSQMPYMTRYQRVWLSPYSDEFELVEELFRKSIEQSVTIISIERVQNPFMWEKYQRKKENMLSSRTAGYTTIQSVNEKQLFHGTNPENVEGICKDNFDWRLYGKNATVYGAGSYFAVSASYSDNYAKRDFKGSKFMFVAKVLAGSYTTGHSSYRRPPAKNPVNQASDLYDSCVNCVSFPTIFVVFDIDQCYPEYIIEYSTAQVGYSFPQPTATRGIPSPTSPSTNRQEGPSWPLVAGAAVSAIAAVGAIAVGVSKALDNKNKSPTTRRQQRSSSACVSRSRGGYPFPSPASYNASTTSYPNRRTKGSTAYRGGRPSSRFSGSRSSTPSTSTSNKFNTQHESSSEDESDCSVM